MPYFINVGRFSGNKSGFGARGWHIWRRERTVFVEFGAIEIHGRHPKRIVWAGTPTFEEKPHRTVEAARNDLQIRVGEKESERRANGDKAYQKLPPGQKITW